MVCHIDGKDLCLLLFRQSEQCLYLVKLVHVLTLVKQYLTVRVVDDTLLYYRAGDNVIHLLRHDYRFTEILSHRLVEVAEVFRHIRRGKGFPSLFHNQLFAYTLESSHLIDEGFHDDDGHNREEFPVFLHRINLKDDEPLAEQVDVLLRVQQEVISSSLVILP